MKSVYKYLTERTISSKQITLRQDLELLDASENGDYERVKELLEDNVDPNTTDTYGRTAISVWDRGESRIMDILVKYGADINHRDSEGNTVLHRIADVLDEEDYETLQKNGIDKTILSQYNKDACQIAYEEKNTEIMQEIRNPETTLRITQSLFRGKQVSQINKIIKIQVDEDDIAEAYIERRNDSISKETFKEFISHEFDVIGDYDVRYKDHIDEINEENMQRIKQIAIDNGWDEEDEDEMWDILEDTDVPSEISNALSNAMQSAEEDYIWKQIKDNMETAGYIMEGDKYYVEIDEDHLFDLYTQEYGHYTTSELLPEIKAVYWSRYGEGYDDKYFNELLKEYL